jgi:large subunit ribosomal protein L31
MRKNIHPPYNLVDVVMTDGTTYQTRTTWGEDGAKLQLLIDPKNHPAYTGNRKVLDSEGRMEKFMKKYGQTTKSA